jgi:hypothetical protein
MAIPDNRVAIVASARQQARSPTPCCWPARRQAGGERSAARSGKGGDHAAADKVVAEIRRRAARPCPTAIQSPIKVRNNIVKTAVDSPARSTS